MGILIYTFIYVSIQAKMEYEKAIKTVKVLKIIKAKTAKSKS